MFDRERKRSHLARLDGQRFSWGARGWRRARPADPCDQKLIFVAPQTANWTTIASTAIATTTSRASTAAAMRLCSRRTRAG